MININLKDNLCVHSPGYVIETYSNGMMEELVIGNKCISPKIEKTTSSTLYDIASLTKTFTAVLVYMAYEEKKINIYSCINEFDSNFKNLKDITILDLLSHNQDIWTDGYLGNSKTKDEFYDILYTAYVKNDKPTYVDTHYIILSTILEKIYNKSYKELCTEKIINKLNLKNTTFDPEPNNTASNNYEYKNDGTIEQNILPGIIHDPKARIAKELGITTGHASIFTTGRDLMSFLLSFFNYKLLKKETIDLMIQHNDCDLYNFNYLKNTMNINGLDINDMFKQALLINPNLKLNNYNYMGTRYRNQIKVLNDIPDKASDKTILFSGFTGPMYTIDFENKIIVIILCNVMHNTKLTRSERKNKTFDMLNEIFNDIKK